MVSLSFWGIFAAIATVSSAVSAAIIGVCKISKGWLQQLIAWLTAIGLSYASWGLDLFPAICEPAWLAVLIQGFFAGLVSNGVYDIEAVKKFFKLIFGEDYPEYVTIEETPSKSDKGFANVMKFQNELAGYIKEEKDKISITVKKI